MANILDELLQEINYGISGPPQPGDTVVSIEPAGATMQSGGGGAHAEFVAEAG